MKKILALGIAIYLICVSTVMLKNGKGPTIEIEGEVDGGFSITSLE